MSTVAPKAGNNSLYDTTAIGTDFCFFYPKTIDQREECVCEQTARYKVALYHNHPSVEVLLSKIGQLSNKELGKWLHKTHFCLTCIKVIKNGNPTAQKLTDSQIAYDQTIVDIINTRLKAKLADAERDKEFEANIIRVQFMEQNAQANKRQKTDGKDAH